MPLVRHVGVNHYLLDVAIKDEDDSAYSRSPMRDSGRHSITSMVLKKTTQYMAPHEAATTESEESSSFSAIATTERNHQSLVTYSASVGEEEEEGSSTIIRHHQVLADDNESTVLKHEIERNKRAEENAERVTALEQQLAKLNCDLAEYKAQADWYKLQHRRLHLEFEDLQAFCMQLQQQNNFLRNGGRKNNNVGGWFNQSRHLKERRRVSYLETTTTTTRGQRQHEQQQQQMPSTNDNDSLFSRLRRSSFGSELTTDKLSLDDTGNSSMFDLKSTANNDPSLESSRWASSRSTKSKQGAERRGSWRRGSLDSAEGKEAAGRSGFFGFFKGGSNRNNKDSLQTDNEDDDATALTVANTDIKSLADMGRTNSFAVKHRFELSRKGSMGEIMSFKRKASILGGEHLDDLDLNDSTPFFDQEMSYFQDSVFSRSSFVASTRGSNHVPDDEFTERMKRTAKLHVSSRELPTKDNGKNNNNNRHRKRRDANDSIDSTFNSLIDEDTVQSLTTQEERSWWKSLTAGGSLKDITLSSDIPIENNDCHDSNSSFSLFNYQQQQKQDAGINNYEYSTTDDSDDDNVGEELTTFANYSDNTPRRGSLDSTTSSNNVMPVDISEPLQTEANRSRIFDTLIEGRPSEESFRDMSRDLAQQCSVMLTGLGSPVAVAAGRDPLSTMAANHQEQQDQDEYTIATTTSTTTTTRRRRSKSRRASLTNKKETEGTTKGTKSGKQRQTKRRSITFDAYQNSDTEVDSDDHNGEDEKPDISILGKTSSRYLGMHALY